MKYSLKIALLLCTLVPQASSLYSATAGAGAQKPTSQQLKELFRAIVSGNTATVSQIINLHPNIVNATCDHKSSELGKDPWEEEFFREIHAANAAKKANEARLEKFLTAVKSGDSVAVTQMMSLNPKTIDETYKDKTLFQLILLSPETPDPIIYEIVKAGYNVNTVDTHRNRLFLGSTALYQAATQKNINRVRMLLMLEADPRAGEIERDAEKRGHYQVSFFLRVREKFLEKHIAQRKITEETMNTGISQINAERTALIVASLHTGPFRDPSQQWWPEEVAKVVAGYLTIPSYSETVIEKEY